MANEQEKNIVSIPDGTTIIDSEAFSGRTDIESVIIPDSVTEIGYCAFYGCTGLTSIIIPDSVKKIGDNAFSGCSNLTSIVIPSSVYNMGIGIFNFCTSLKSMKVAEDNQYFDSRDNCNGIIWTHLGVLAEGCSTTVIPHGVVTIRAFQGCTGLKEIVIPDSVKEIGDCAFLGCTGLKEIVIPDSVTEIGWRAFSGCTGLTHLTIPSTVRLDSGAFQDCTALKTVEIKGEMKPFPERIIWEEDD